MRDQFIMLYEKGVRKFYVGGALGVDMWAGEIVLRLKEQPEYNGIELVVVCPFPNHDEGWDSRSRERLTFLIQHSTEHIIIGKFAIAENYLQRNRYMVDHADCLLAVYDNDVSIRSGTRMTVNYAETKNKPIVFIHPDIAKITMEGWC